jgi:polysaccharide biosynthesis transport protein
MKPVQIPPVQGHGYTEEINIGKYWAVMKRRWFPASLIFLLTAVPASMAALNHQSNYQADGKLLFRKKNTSLSLLIDASRTQRVGELEGLSSLNTPVDTEAEVLRTTPLLETVLGRQPLQNQQGQPLKPHDVLPKLTVKGIKGTDFLQVAFKHHDAKSAAAFVNTLMQVYLEQNSQNNQREAVAARDYITQQLPVTETKLRMAEANLQSFKEQNNVVVLQEESISAVKMLANLDEQIAKARTSLADTVSRTQSLEGKLGLSEREAIALNAVSQSPAVQQVLDEYRKTQAQLAIQQTRYKSPHPEITGLERKVAALQAVLGDRVGQVLGAQAADLDQTLQIDKLKEKLIEEMVSSAVNRQGIASQLDTLYQTRDNYQKRANVLPQLENQQQDLERQVKTAKSEYETLVQRFQEVKIAETQNLGNAQIASPAVVPDQPLLLNRWLIFGAGLTAASLLALLAAFALDLRDVVIRSVKDVREHYRYPFLGEIPRLRLRNLSGMRLVRPEVDPLGSEVYRLVQTNLKFFNKDGAVKSMVVTSALAKEGKSTLVANLASTMAQLGDRVLVIDADLRHPTQHVIWDISNQVGLSTFLSQTQEDLPAGLVAKPMPNVDVLPAGPPSYNPLSLLGSLQMEWLIRDYTQQYDWVIIDGPPLLVSDALALTKTADGVLLVARPGVIDTESAKVANELLANSGQRVLGVVANAVTNANHPSGYLRRTADYYYRQPAGVKN